MNISIFNLFHNSHDNADFQKIKGSNPFLSIAIALLAVAIFSPIISRGGSRVFKSLRSFFAKEIDEKNLSPDDPSKKTDNLGQSILNPSEEDSISEKTIEENLSPNDPSKKTDNLGQSILNPSEEDSISEKTIEENLSF